MSTKEEVAIYGDLFFGLVGVKNSFQAAGAGRKRLGPPKRESTKVAIRPSADAT